MPLKKLERKRLDCIGKCLPLCNFKYKKNGLHHMKYRFYFFGMILISMLILGYVIGDEENQSFSQVTTNEPKRLMAC